MELLAALCAHPYLLSVQIGSYGIKAPLAYHHFFPSILHTTVISFLSESEGASVSLGYSCSEFFLGASVFHGCINDAGFCRISVC